MIRIRLLGPVEVSIDGRPAPRELSWRKTLALIIHLALAPRRTRTREHLVALLWADKPDQNARRSLAEELSRWRRKALGEGGLESDGRQVRLAPGLIRLDLEDLQERVAAEDWEVAAELIGGEFLERFDAGDCGEFEDWLVAQRRTVTALSLTVLLRRGEQLLAAGDCRAAASLAERGLGLDPLHEPSLRLAMRGLALAGDRSLALKRHEEVCARLKEALGALPEAATEALAARIRAQRQWQLPAVSRGEAVPELRQPLIGREGELASATGCWGRVTTDRRAAVLAIDADSGLGKTRLLEELAARARLDGGGIAQLRAVEADATVPGSVLLGLLRGGLLETPGAAAATPGALAAVAECIVEWAERFPAAAGSPLGLGAAFTEICRAVAEEGPLVLAVDDAHWADGDSLRSLTALVRDLARLPVLLALAAQPMPPRSELDLLRSQIGRDLAGEQITLLPLTTSSLRSLVAWRFSGYSAVQADRLARRLAADSAGSPFIAVELLQAVALGLDLEGGGVWPEPDRTETDTFPGALPSSLIAAIRIRFRRLGASTQEVLRVAAVLPGPVSAERLSRVTRLDSTRLAEGLDEAEWVRWLAADSRGYDFPARILREVIERDMSTPGQRRRLLEADPG